MPFVAQTLILTQRFLSPLSSSTHARHSRFPNVIKLEDCFVYCHSLSDAFTADLSRFLEFPFVIKVYNFEEYF
ncbi:hypothetical protein NPIL_15011 [Nephila pilipes]|uniref:Uncharacterized protein n=1 Tax=Nephila pilipes TaxID=299642 RepID=A0A8X6QF30_NEPPI|nr:hypothetical protein NPIL_15011 [Nephila pilipes]